LQQPVHGRGPGQIDGNLLDGLILGGGQAEREQAADAGVDFGIGDQRRCSSQPGSLLFPQRQRQLQHEQFLIDKAAASLFQTGWILRVVDLGHRRLDGHQAMGFQVLGRKDLVQQAGVGNDRRADDPPQVRLLDAVGQRVQRQNAPGLDLAIALQRFHPRMDHFPAAAMETRRSGQQHARPSPETLAHVRLIEPHGAQVLVVLPNEYAQQRPAGARVPQFDLLDHAAHAGRLVLLQFVDRQHAAGVVVVAREEEQQVTGRAQPQTFQQRGQLRSDALDELNRRREALPGVLSIVGGHAEIITGIFTGWQPVPGRGE
jgi:hypothetical protein